MKAISTAPHTTSLFRRATNRFKVPVPSFIRNTMSDSDHQSLPPFSSPRMVVKKVLAKTQHEGDGAVARRAIGRYNHLKFYQFFNFFFISFLAFESLILKLFFGISLHGFLSFWKLGSYLSVDFDFSAASWGTWILFWCWITFQVLFFHFFISFFFYGWYEFCADIVVCFVMLQCPLLLDFLTTHTEVSRLSHTCYRSNLFP